MTRLVCVGLATLDVVQVVDAVPRPDEKVVARSLDVTFGGPAANAAATAVAVGVPTRLVTALGGSPLAVLVRDALVRAGVEVVDLLDAAGDASPAVSTVLVTAATGERAVVSVNATTTGDLGDAATSRLDGLLAGATAVLVDGHHLAAGVRVAAAARARHVPVVLDGGSWKPGLDELITQVDAAVLSGDFRLPGAADGTAATRATGATGMTRAELDTMLDAVAALGPRDVARSAGAGPVRVRSCDGEGAVRYDVAPAAVPPAEVVDTLGAGDVLHGALAAALASGESFGAALQAGMDVATRSVRYPGALGWARG